MGVGLENLKTQNLKPKTHNPILNLEGVIMKEKHNYYSGGYYLVKGCETQEPMNKEILPAMIFSISSCVCKIYPDIWALSWVKNSEEEIEKVKTDLNLDNSGFFELQRYADLLFNSNKFGWPNVFFDINTPGEFYHKYMKDIPHIKLLGIGLSEEYVNKFLEKEKPLHGHGKPGVYENLSCHKYMETSKELGFEILGYDSGSFHSFICNRLETDYRDRLNIRLNENGLIESYDDAAHAAEYTMKDDVGAEPALWMPWVIYEYIIR
jgi:hypothetical protein